MPAVKNPDDSPLGLWGTELRYYRTKAGLSQEELGERVNYSAKTVSAVETGRLAPSPDFAERCDTEFETDGALTRWRDKLVGRSVLPEWFRPWVGVEAESTMLRGYEDYVMPGLAQTEAYARAVLGRDEATVAARLERQQILYREDPPPPTLRLVIEESVLNRPIGDAAVMAEQVEHLIALVELPHVNIQVIPMGAYATGSGSFALTTTPEGTVLYLDTAARGFVVDSKEDVEAVEVVFDTILAETLPQRASLDLMKEMAKKWRST